METPCFSHSLCLIHYSRIGYPLLYDRISYFLSKGFVVVYAIESNFKETINRMVDRHSDLQRQISSGSLVVLDRNSLYNLKQDADATGLIRTWNSLTKNFEDQSMSYNGVIVVSTPEVYHESHNFARLLRFESAIGKKVLKPVDMICCYTTQAIETMTLRQFLSILNDHRYTLHKDWSYIPVTSERLIDIIKVGLDKALGPDMSELTFKILRTVYHLNEKNILANFSLFEDMVRKLLGSSANAVFGFILNEITKELMFDNEFASLRHDLTHSAE